MKRSSLLLAASLTVNVILALAVLRRPGTMTPTVAATDVMAKSTARPVAASVDVAALQAALASGDAAALAAAGISPEVVRYLSMGRAFDRFQSLMRAARPAPSDERYWKRPNEESSLPRDRMLAMHKAEQQFNEAVRDAYGEDLDALFSDRAPLEQFLARDKRDRLQRVERDYQEMERQLMTDWMGGTQLPSDREKLKLLRAEKERDVAALLTPEEREQMELRTSSTASSVRARYGNVLQSEEEYKKIFALQKAFDDRFNKGDANGGATAPDARRVAELKLQEDVRALLSAEQWAAVQRDNDQDRRTLAAFVRRLDLPDTAIDRALTVRQSYASQSMQINANADLSATDRRAQLQALATQAQIDLQGVLGAEGGPAFAQRAAWIGLLKNGQAFSLDPKDSPNANISYGTTAHPLLVPKAGPTPPRG